MNARMTSRQCQAKVCGIKNVQCLQEAQWKEAAQFPDWMFPEEGRCKEMELWAEPPPPLSPLINTIISGGLFFSFFAQVCKDTLVTIFARSLRAICQLTKQKKTKTKTGRRA